MKIKICGLFREADIEYVNEARPDYIGFVFAPGRRNVSPVRAAELRHHLSGDIVPVGVFVNAPVSEIAALYGDGVISAVQLHGEEDEAYIDRLREANAAGGHPPIPVIKTIKSDDLKSGKTAPKNADHYLIDSGSGSGKTFDWNILSTPRIVPQSYFLAGGICLSNIEKAMALNPFAVDISSGAETDGIKDKEKIVRLTAMARRAGSI